MKKSVAIALALSLGLFVAVILGSLRVFAQINPTTTSYNVMTAERLDTFSAKGKISSLVFDSGTSSLSLSTATTTNASQSQKVGDQTNKMITRGTNTITTKEKVEAPYVLSGDWNLRVDKGKINDFTAKFTMVRIDGTERHTHELINFRTDNDSEVQLDPTNITFIKGTSDFRTNGINNWRAVDTFLLIDKLKVLSIIPDSQKVDDHFKGQPIYGIIVSIKDKSGNDIKASLSNMTSSFSARGSNFGSNGTEEGKLIANSTGKTENKSTNNSSLESLYRKFFGSSCSSMSEC